MMTLYVSTYVHTFIMMHNICSWKNSYIVSQTSHMHKMSLTNTFFTESNLYNLTP